MAVTESVTLPSYLDIALTLLRHDATCACGRALRPGERAGVTRSTQQPVCLPCVKRALWEAVEGESH